MATLTWGTDSVGQGQEWGIQGPTSVPQNWVPSVNKGHSFRVPITLLEAMEMIKVMEKGAHHEPRKFMGPPPSSLSMEFPPSHLNVPEQQLGGGLQRRLRGYHFAQRHPPALCLSLAGRAEPDAMLPARHGH